MSCKLIRQFHVHHFHVQHFQRPPIIHKLTFFHRIRTTLTPQYGSASINMTRAESQLHTLVRNNYIIVIYAASYDVAKTSNKCPGVYYNNGLKPLRLLPLFVPGLC